MFDEKKHPRGQPGNAGQFAKSDKSGSTSDKLVDSVRKYSDTPAEDMENMGIGKLTVSDFVLRVKNGQVKPREKFELGEITERARKDIEHLTGKKLNATRHAIGIDEVKHIEKGHGEHGKTDHSMSSLQDYEQIADVLSDYDSLDWAYKHNGEIDTTNAYLDENGKPSKLIRFTKKYRDNEQYAIEAVNDTKGRLHVISSYKKRTDS